MIIPQYSFELSSMNEQIDDKHEPEQILQL